ncbi:MAG: hypothetical protein O3C40_28640 [Planctomycetota bacterium]|nr:hypothetical protein [Planctomycetota bacterium]
MKTMRQKLITALPAAVACFLLIPTAAADIVHLEDVIIDGSACIGFDCVNGEVFGLYTIIIKENNLRISAVDTSTGGYPTQDWSLIFNDHCAGCLNKFSIEATTGLNGPTPFTIEAGGSATNHALYVDDAGRIGFGTNSPAVDLHVKTGNTPTLRLEQDGTSGWPAQIWDIAGNEAGFFVREVDVTGFSKLPFRLRPGAPASSIDVATSGNVGFGTYSPTSSLHVRRNSATKIDMLTLENTGASMTNFKMSNSARQWLFTVQTSGNFAYAPIGSGFDFTMSAATGNFVIDGNFVAGGGQLNVPDYVFDPGYELRPLKELAKFVEEERHLPNIPSAEQIKKDGLDMTGMQMKLLEKVEELTLYTIAQQKTIDDLNARMSAMEPKTVSPDSLD